MSYSHTCVMYMEWGRLVAESVILHPKIRLQCIITKLVIATSWVISDQTNIFHVTRFCTYVVWKWISRRDLFDLIRGFSLVRDCSYVYSLCGYFVAYWFLFHSRYLLENNNKTCIETKFILIICRYYKIEHCCKYSGWKYFDIIPRKRIKYIGFRKKSFRLQKCFDWKRNELKKIAMKVPSPNYINIRGYVQ